MVVLAIVIGLAFGFAPSLRPEPGPDRHLLTRVLVASLFDSD
jgi:hypothetical protein